MRWLLEDENLRMRKFGPKKEDHPSIGMECPACKVPFAEGDFTTLVALGPGASKEERDNARRGRTYNAVAIEVHWECSSFAYRLEERENEV